MGIPGLYKFVVDNEFLVPHQLKDTYVVIDFCNFSYFMNNIHIKCASVFGGDYDICYHYLYTFLDNLLKCNVTPIVMMDGGLEAKKLRTKRARMENKLMILKQFSKSSWEGKFHPLLLHIVLIQVLDELNILRFRCFFEVDREMACIAKYLNCPILSNDSDFFIFDVLCIPLFSFTSIHCSKSKKSGNYFNCLIYDSNVFLKKFDHFDRSLLPLCAAILGNDYWDNKCFQGFFNHISIPQSKKSRNVSRQRFIMTIISWLSNESKDSAIQRILTHTPNCYVNSALIKIESSFEYYTLSEDLITHIINFLGLGKTSDVKLLESLPDLERETISKLPGEFIRAYYKGKIPSAVIDMIHLKCYFVPFQVEDVTKVNSHTVCYPLVSVLYDIICDLTGITAPLTIHDTSRGTLRKFILKRCRSNEDKLKCIKPPSNIINESPDVKIKFFHELLSITDDAVKMLSFFSNDWLNFFMCLIYWTNVCSVSESQFHAVLIMAIANYVQSQIGHYCVTYRSFMKKNARLMRILSKSETTPTNHSGNSISDYLNSITKLELLRFTAKFIKLRKPDSEAIEKGYFMSTIHNFATFQSILYHVRELNLVMYCPLPEIKISNFYSGTFLYNIHFIISRQNNAVKFLSDNMKEMPNIKKLYHTLFEKLNTVISTVKNYEKPVKIVWKS